MRRIDISKLLLSNYPINRLKIFNPFTIHRKGRRAKAFFALALVCLIWGTTWIASKQAVKHMPALQMAGIRQIFGGLCYVIFFMAKGAKFPRGKEWVTVVILSILNFTLTNGLSIWGVKYISAGLGAIIAAIFPLWLVVIGLFTSAKKIPAKAIAGLLLGFAGVCVIFYDHLYDFLNADFRFGIFLSLIATWTWAFGTIYTKQKAASFNPYFSLGLQMMISGIFLVTLTNLTHSDTVNSFLPLSAIPWQAWAAIAYLVLIGSLIGFVAYLYALQNLPTEQASIYAYVNPIVAVLIGWLMFNEKPTPFLMLGGVVTLVGVYLVNKAFKGLPAVEQPETG
jgi:drug/metabolite transporter (DMT)-like permease